MKAKISPVLKGVALSLRANVFYYVPLLLGLYLADVFCGLAFGFHFHWFTVWALVVVVHLMLKWIAPDLSMAWHAGRLNAENRNASRLAYQYLSMQDKPSSPVDDIATYLKKNNGTYL